ncbi:MAG: asparagine synthase (glutamine-hydrolyzing) [Nitrospina sp.]|jgi:asparagine synthase (glutamine-hydrolysing)|nr:asparagine synthase (glutamine-hydrolyzing) [Nitrospina sp.]MBT3875905.1 asparagine synthase (glutamine-hydrolyzing) [Nitrospina sp.]MBT4046960.1 asparagine synthase (glutamine-hydrolyzing) [Nitrospina sp.]MBT4557320.1 asparagine synthase (glutamine-hydrolyzing) [Nitrospina sp.]MBT5347592.1 asparagine synthase (glutamine-hydrolyzing) [Nitrospina sp.]
MCGIAGLINFDPSDQAENSGKVLRNMLDALRHRGPDDRGEERIEVANGPTLHLGHQRFSIIDLTQAGHQPMANDDESVWVSTNSEIYNYKELRNELAGKFQFHSESDTEVLLRAYENWGVQCLDKLLGMFSFAIWDSEKEALFIARDRLGIKPLYYNIQGKQFAFASELRSLLTSGLIQKSINPSGLYNYLSFGHSSAPETLIDSVRELKAGHYLWIDKNGNWQEKEYWNPFNKNIAPAPDIQEQTKAIIEEAINCRRASDVPLGAFLSGGIDSSVVVGNLAKFSDDPISTLTIGFAEKQFDESQFSQEIADRFKTNHQIMRLDEDQLLQTLPSSLSAMDQPTIDGINTYLISRSAHEAGLKVVLSGLGGDELFGGYPSFHLIPKLLQRKKLMKAIPQSLARWGIGLTKGLFSPTQAMKLDHWVQGKLSGAHEYFLIRALFCQEPVLALFADRAQAQIEIEKGFQRSLRLTENGTDLFNQISFLETFHYLQNMLLRDTDMMSMAHPLEVRVPFMDHRLVELMFQTPGKEKDSRESYAKPLLVDCMKSLVPDSVSRRKKMGFTFPFEMWMRGALRPEIETVLLSPMQQLEGLLSQKAVEMVWNDFLSGQVSWSRPWALYVLKSWVNKNLS